MKKLCLLLVLLLPMYAFSFSGNGSGTVEDPYQVTNIDQLQEMNDDLTAHYILMNDIDASETKNWDEERGFLPIGFDSDNGFVGSFDGRNYIISELHSNSAYRKANGLFGFIGKPESRDYKVRNLRIVDCHIGGYDIIGALAGLNDGYIENCYSNGQIMGNDYVGGLVGYNDRSIINSSTDSEIFGSNYVGGLCGLNSDKIDECHSTGNVRANHYVGGLCGNNIEIIVNSYSTGSVKGNILAGGFCGMNTQGHISYCYSTGSVEGTESTGGFCGGNLYKSTDIMDCYCTGDVLGDMIAGGFCGKNDNDANIKNCYSIGSVVGNNNIGGFCGTTDKKEDIQNCFWDTETSGNNLSPGGFGKTTSKMMKMGTFTNWDFYITWCIVEGKTYPHLRAIEDCDNLVFVEDTRIETEIRSFPNPFSQYSVISYQLSVAEPVKIVVYNSLGREIAILVDEHQAAGRHEARFDGSGHPAGMYYSTILIGGNSHSGKMLLVR